MSHYEIEAQPALQQDVQCLWILEEAQTIYNHDAVLPDSSVELVVNCGAPLIWEMEDGTQVETPRVFLKGLQDKPLRLKVIGDCSQLIGMRLCAWSAPSLLDTQAKRADTPIIAPSRDWRDLARSLEATVRRSGYAEAAHDLQQFVSDTRCRPHPDMMPIRIAGEALYASKGQIRMSELAACCHLSVSQFERRFRQLTGVSPKMFARLVRFEAVRNTLFCDPTRRPLDLVYEFGYTDQAHFIHDFKAFSDRTPGEYAASIHARDAEFLQYG